MHVQSFNFWTLQLVIACGVAIGQKKREGRKRNKAAGPRKKNRKALEK
jgi:hypothetical protein